MPSGVVRNGKKGRRGILRESDLRHLKQGVNKSGTETLSGVDQEKIDSQLKGNTLRVYWLMLKSPSASVGIREVQRALKFSSPTLAQYHLEKLRELGVVRKESSEYMIVPDVKVGVLRQFYRFGTVLVPRFVLYAVLFTVMLGFLFFIIAELTLISAFAFVLAISAAAIFWYEAIRAIRERPRG